MIALFETSDQSWNSSPWVGLLSRIGILNRSWRSCCPKKMKTPKIAIAFFLHARCKFFILPTITKKARDPCTVLFTINLKSSEKLGSVGVLTGVNRRKTWKQFFHGKRRQGRLETSSSGCLRNVPSVGFQPETKDNFLNTRSQCQGRLTPLLTRACARSVHLNLQ